MPRDAQTPNRGTDPDGVDGMDALDRKLAETERMVDTRLAASEQALERALVPSPAAPDSGTGLRLDALPPPAAVEAGSRVRLRMSEEALQQTAAFVFYAPHVQTNTHYKAMAAATVFVPKMDVATVNAFATHRLGSGEQHTADGPLIVVLGGAAVVVQLASLAIAADLAEGRAPTGSTFLRAFVRHLGTRLQASGGEFSERAAGQTVRETGLTPYLEDQRIIRRVHSFALGMMAYIIAHELGHIALGHTLGACVNLEISRNQEREADSFASSVISSSPFGEYLIAGPVIWELVWVWGQYAGNAQIARTHPLARERLLDFLRANAEQAAAIGITPATLHDFLPPEK